MIDNYKRLVNIILGYNDTTREDQKKDTFILYYKKNKNEDNEDYIPIKASENKGDLIDFLRYKTNCNFNELAKHNRPSYDFYIEKANDI